jgi:hypothetical protein
MIQRKRNKILNIINLLQPHIFQTKNRSLGYINNHYINHNTTWNTEDLVNQACR